MRAIPAAQRYLEAWNAHDPDAIAASLAPGGTFADPALPEPVDATGTPAYAAGLFAGFPDLAFSVESIGAMADDAVAVQWTMTGTNRGSYMGLPPTGREVRLPGADVIRVADGLVSSVVGYFDTAAVPRQLGLQVVVQPTRAGPYRFGVALSARRSDAEPGAISVTVLEARGDDEAREVRGFSQRTLADLIGAPGFHGWVGASIGPPDVHATPEDVFPALRRNEHHAAGTARFFAVVVLAAGARRASGRRTA